VDRAEVAGLKAELDEKDRIIRDLRADVVRLRALLVKARSAARGNRETPPKKE